MSTRRWEEVAEDYNRIFEADEVYWNVLETVVGEAAAGEGRTVLDLGCGTGNLTALLVKKYPGTKVCGVDPADNMVRLVRDRFREVKAVEITKGEGIRIPYLSEHFDCVVSNLALHHVLPEQRTPCAMELARVLKPGGRLVYADLFWETPGRRDDPARMREIIEKISGYALHCLAIGAPEMAVFLCQQLPLHLEEKNEYVAPVEDWLNPLGEAGFERLEVFLPPPPGFAFRIIRGEKARERGSCQLESNRESSDFGV